MTTPDPFPTLDQWVPITTAPPMPFRDRVYPPPNRLWADPGPATLYRPPPVEPIPARPTRPRRRRSLDALLARLGSLYARRAALDADIAATETALRARVQEALP